MYMLANTSTTNQYTWITPLFEGISSLLRDLGTVPGIIALIILGILFTSGIVIFLNAPYILQKIFNKKDKESKEEIEDLGKNLISNIEDIKKNVNNSDISGKIDELSRNIENMSVKLSEQLLHINKLVASITDENYKNLSSSLLKLHLFQLKTDIYKLLKENRLDLDTSKILKLDAKESFKKELTDILKRFILSEQAFEEEVESIVFPMLDDVIDSIISMKSILVSDNFELNGKPKVEYMLNIKKQDIEKSLIDIYKNIIQSDTNIMYFKKINK